MPESIREGISPEENKAEVEQKITAIAMDFENKEKTDPSLLLSVIAVAIANAYEKAGNDQERDEIDSVVSNKLAELKLLPTGEDYDSAEIAIKLMLQNGLYKKIAHLMAGKLRRKPVEESDVVSETRERLAIDDSDNEE